MAVANVNAWWRPSRKGAEMREGKKAWPWIAARWAVER
jgi:hypothetical protein